MTTLRYATTHEPSRGDLREMRENVRRGQSRGVIDYLAGERLVCVIDAYEDHTERAARIDDARSELELAIDDLGLEADSVSISGTLDDLEIAPDVRAAIEKAIEVQSREVMRRATESVAASETALREALAKIERAIEGKPEPKPEPKGKKK